jgi:hypothetical protein
MLATVLAKKEIALANFLGRLNHTVILVIQVLLKETCITFEKTLTIRLLGEIKAGSARAKKEIDFLATVSSSMEMNLVDVRENQSWFLEMTYFVVTHCLMDKTPALELKKHATANNNLDLLKKILIVRIFSSFLLLMKVKDSAVEEW